MLNETELQEFEKRRDAASQVVDDLCHGRRDWIMHVPARMDSDPDLVIAAALRDNSALLSTVRELQRQLAERDNELEVERLRLAACGTAAIGYFTDCKEEYRSASLDDVLRLLKRADELQRQVAEREADAKRYRWLRDPKSDIALVIDKLIDEPVGVYRDGSMAYEYRSGSDLDAAIDAALNTEHTG